MLCPVQRALPAPRNGFPKTPRGSRMVRADLRQVLVDGSSSDSCQCLPFPLAATTTATITANVSASDALPNRRLPLPNRALPATLLLRCSALSSHLDDRMVTHQCRDNLTCAAPALHKKPYQRLASYHTLARRSPLAFAPNCYTCVYPRITIK